jgi:excisionase family DNA binding protein
MPAEPTRVDRLVAALAYEYQREQVDPENARPGRRRPELREFVDITQYAHLTDEQVARALGVKEAHEVDYVAAWIADERAGLLGPDEGRCEAGTKRWGWMRCHRRVLPDERWCGSHHPTPPVPAMPPARLDPWDLSVRPDGALLQAVYELTDQQRDLARLVTSVLDRLDRAEHREKEDGPVLLTTQQAAELLGVTAHTIHDMCKNHRLPWLRIGRQYRFRAKDLDDWLAARIIRSLR